MPRFSDPLKLAVHQGALWNPLTLRPLVLLDPADERTVSLSSGNIVASIANKGASGGTFTAPAKSAGFEITKRLQFGAYWLLNTSSSVGFISSYSDSWTLNSSTFRTVICLAAGTSVTSISVGLSVGVTSTCAMNYGSSSIDLGWNYTSGTRIVINAAAQPLAIYAATIISHIFSTTSFWGKYSQGTPSTTFTSTQTSSLSPVTRTGNLYAWGSNSLNPVIGLLGPIFYVDRRLSLADVYRVEGWMAWRYGCPICLEPNHPYKSRPPTI